MPLVYIIPSAFEVQHKDRISTQALLLGHFGEMGMKKLDATCISKSWESTTCSVRNTLLSATCGING